MLVMHESLSELDSQSCYRLYSENSDALDYLCMMFEVIFSKMWWEYMNMEEI